MPGSFCLSASSIVRATRDLLFRNRRDELDFACDNCAVGQDVKMVVRDFSRGEGALGGREARAVQLSTRIDFGQEMITLHDSIIVEAQQGTSF